MLKAGAANPDLEPKEAFLQKEVKCMLRIERWIGFLQFEDGECSHQKEQPIQTREGQARDILQLRSINLTGQRFQG